jgi:signal transduction histidine kinase
LSRGTAAARASGRSGPLGLLGLGIAGGVALLCVAAMDLGDPAAAVERRAQRAASAEAELVRLAWERALTSDAPPAPPLGSVLRAPRARAEGPQSDEPSAEPVRAEPARAEASSPAVGDPAVAWLVASQDSVFVTLLRAALGEAALGHTPRALALVREALAKFGADATPGQRAEARLRELAWAHAADDDDGARVARAELLAMADAPLRGGVPYPLLAALAGPVDGELLREVHGRLERGELVLPRAEVTIDVEGAMLGPRGSGARGARPGGPGLEDVALEDVAPGDVAPGDVAPGDVTLAARPSPERRALLDAFEARAPELDWRRALGLDEALTRALDAFVPETVPDTEGRWQFFELDTARDDIAAEVLGACYLEGPASSPVQTVTLVTRDGLARALEDGVRRGGAGDPSDDLSTGPPNGAAADGGPDLAVLRVAGTRAALTDDVLRLLGPVELAGAGLHYDVVAPDLAREVRRERRRLLALRGGLAGLGVFVALAGILSARALARERRLARLRSTFVASVSHDLRTPLASILLLVENLEHGRVATEAARTKYHGALRQEAERLRRMVEDLLDASRVERGDGPRIAPAPVALAPFLEELEAAFVERATRDGARVSWTREAMPTQLVLDADAVRRAAWNLFENALRHGHRAHETADIRIAVSCDGDTLTFDVADRGPGVPARHREAIFRPFERAREPRHTAERGATLDYGTGLGLAIVRAIARAHGGEVELVDGDVGARFRLTVRPPSDPTPGGEEGAA